MWRWCSCLEICVDGRVRRVDVEMLERTTDYRRRLRGCVRRQPDVGERVGSEAEHTQDGLQGIVDPFIDPDAGAGPR